MYLPRSLISHLYTHLVRSHHPLSPPVLILVALETDSICACRILTALLKRDYIQHKIQPVSGYADLSRAGDELIKPMKTTQGGNGGVVICLGVGGLVDLSTILGLEDEDGTESAGGVEVWVMDARRPWNLSNVFGSGLHQLTAEDAPAARPKADGIDQGCIQKSYKPGQGGIIVFDDGDIATELGAERDAYCALIEMPEIGEEDEDEDDDDDTDEEEGADQTASSRKRKSWSDRDDEAVASGGEEEEPPRQRRRSNSGSSISSSSPRSRTPSSHLSSPASEIQPPKPQTARQLRRKLLALRRSHESVLEKYYSLGTSYSEPISSLAYSLASEMGREDNDLLWLAIVGVTSLELSGHTSTGLGISHPSISQLPGEFHKSWRATRSSRTYALLRDEVRRLNPPLHDQSPSISPTATTTSPSDTSIRLSPDPRFILLRHWSLYDSMLHSPYLAARLHVWNESGVKRLHKLLAKMGVSLTQCKQTYTHMDMDLKKTLRDRLLKYSAVYGLDELVPVGTGRASYEQEGWGFIRSWGWKAQLSAVDVGVILGAILEVGGNHTSLPTTMSTTYTGSSQRTNIPEEVEDRGAALLPRFFAAYDALAPNEPAQLLSSIPLAQHLLRSILRTGSSLLVKHQIRHLRAFRMAVVKEGPDLALFAGSPGALVKLALWLGEAITVSDKDKKKSDGATPLVLAALDESRGTYVVVGTGGGIGGGEDMDARKAKAEARQAKQEVRDQKRKIREEKKAARAAERAVRELDGESDDEAEDESEEESEVSSDDEDEDDDELQAKMQQRGYGRNRFGIAFQEVVEETNARVKIDSFDHCVVEVKKEDLGGFLEGLSLKSVVGK